MNTGVLNRTMRGAKNHRHVDSECPLLLHATTPTTSSCSTTALEKKNARRSENFESNPNVFTNTFGKRSGKEMFALSRQLCYHVD